MLNRYDQGFGDEAQLGDKVSSHSLGYKYNGAYVGVVGGFSDIAKTVAIIVLDIPHGKILAVNIPVVCLTKI